METLHESGEIIADRYRIIDTLGRGGVGITYGAEDLESKKRVALKVLSLRRMTDWKNLELFEREAKVMAQLNHPDIPRYLDYFQTDSDGDRSFYIAQELAPGDSLAALVENGWQPEETKVQLVAVRILAILVYLQSLTPPVIHRDIKPSNIIRSEDGQIFLVDFGAVVDSYRHTVAGGSTVVGTYGYMAPEQFRGQAALETDLYGLGATLLFLLTGKSPADLPRRQLRIDFRSSVRISQHFADWLEKILSPAREDRFQSAEEALAVLQGAGTLGLVVTKYDKPKGSPIRLTAAEESLTVEIPPIWLRSNFHAVISLLPPVASGILALAVVWTATALNSHIFTELIVFVLCLRFLAEIGRPLGNLIFSGISRSRLEVDKHYFRFEQYLLDWRSEKRWHRIEKIVGVRLNRVSLPLRKKPLTFLTVQLSSVEKYSFGFLLERQENEWLLGEIAAVMEKVQPIAAKENHIKNRVPMSGRVAFLRQRKQTQLTSIFFIAIALGFMGLGIGIPFYWGFVIGGTVLLLPLVNKKESSYYQGLACYREGDYLGAVQEYDRAIKMNANLVEAYYERGNAYFAVGDLSKAIADYNRALEINPEFILARYELCAIYTGQGEYRAAIEECDRIISINPDLAAASIRRGNACSALKDYQTAIQDYDRAINLNPNFVEAYFGRGAARHNIGDNRGAVEDFSELIRLQPTENNYYNRGVIYYLLDDCDRAIRDLTQAIELNANFAAAYYNRSNARYDLGDERGATEDYNLALELESADIDPGDEHGFYGRGLALSRMGKVDEARADLEEAARLCSDRQNTVFQAKIMAAIDKL